MPTLKLTNAKVRKLDAPTVSGATELYWDTETPGFGVRCSGRTNRKVYVVQGRVRELNKDRRVTLGPVDLFDDVDDARTKAQEALKQMWDGKDPKRGRALQGDVPTLREALDIYPAARKKKSERTLSDKTVSDYRWFVERHLGDWLDKPLSAITDEMVDERHKEIADAIGKEGNGRSGRVSANLTFRAFRAMWNALDGYKPKGSDNKIALPGNPARHLVWFEEGARSRHVKANDMAAFYRGVLALENTTHRDMILTLLFTGMRRGEAAKLTWDQVDLDNRSFEIPEKNTKTRKALNIPICGTLHDVLRRRHDEYGEDRGLGREAYVFPAPTKSGHVEELASAFRTIRRTTGVAISAHDLRRTFATAAEAAEVGESAQKALVNHSASITDMTARYQQLSVERLRGPVRRVERVILGWIYNVRVGDTLHGVMVDELGRRVEKSVASALDRVRAGLRAANINS